MYALLGFFLSAYLAVPILGVAIVGLIAAAIMYMNITEKSAQPAVALAAESNGGVIDDDE